MLYAFRSSRLTIAFISITILMLMVSSTYGQEPGSKTSDLENEVATVKAENAALRERLRAIEEQQKVMLDLLSRVQQRLETTPVDVAPLQQSAVSNGNVFRETALTAPRSGVPFGAAPSSTTTGATSENSASAASTGSKEFCWK